MLRKIWDFLLLTGLNETDSDILVVMVLIFVQRGQLSEVIFDENIDFGCIFAQVIEFVSYISDDLRIDIHNAYYSFAFLMECG